MTQKTDNSIIHILDTLTANQIAAGEVVERPFSVVKELVENAMDAGATRIVVTLCGNDCEKIRVVDNGCGMSPADLRMCVLRHATSKIKSADDLNRLSTLGFRGEALPSIASVSLLTITSKQKNQDWAYRVRVEDGKASVPEECTANNGTSVEVDRLFYNAPARKKFLKSPRTEMGLISELISKYAVCRPDISFTLTNGNHRAIVTPGNGQRDAAIISVYGSNLMSDLTELSETEILSGMVSLPQLTRANRNQYNIFVNGRLVRSKEITMAIDSAYHTFIPENKYPVTFLFMNLPADGIDVNVHPGKLEIKLRDAEFVKQQVTSAISDALHKQTARRFSTLASPVVEISPYDTFSRTEGSRLKSENRRSNLGEAQPLTGSNLFRALSGHPVEDNFIKAQVMDVTEIEKMLAKVDAEIAAEKETQKEKKRLFYTELQILGQFAGTFIIASLADELYIIDQHAAAERIRYEKILAKAEQCGDDSEMLVIPITFDTTYQESLLLTDYMLDIRNAGFILEYFGDTSYVIRGVPLWLGDLDPEATLRAIIDQLQTESKTKISVIRQNELFMAACKSAVKGNQYLTNSDIASLFIQLDQCKDPFTCPHGRPIACKITLDEIYKRFLRGSI